MKCVYVNVGIIPRLEMLYALELNSSMHKDDKPTALALPTAGAAGNIFRKEKFFPFLT